MSSTISESTSADVSQSDTDAGLWSVWVWFWGGLALISIPMLIPYFIGMWRLEHYQFFPFAMLAVGVLAYTRMDRESPICGPRNTAVWITVAVAVFLILFSLLTSSTWLGAVGFVMIGAAFFWSQSGENDATLLGLSIPLLMLVRLPVGLDQLLVTRLQGMTTRMASVLLDVVGVTHAVQGNVIQLADRELFVAEACSGIQSVFTLAFLATVIVAYYRRRLWLTPLYLLIAVILAIAGNVIRVTTVAVAEFFWGIDLASGFSHDVIGYAALVIAGLMLLSFDRLVVFFLHPASILGDDMSSNPILSVWDYFVADTDSRVDYSRGAYVRDDDVRPMKATPESSWIGRKKVESLLSNRTVLASCIAVVVLVLVGASIQASRASIETPMASLLKEHVIYQPEPTMLSGKIGDLDFYEHRAVRGGSDPRLGQNSDVWTCKFNELDGQFVVSQTYSGWHELCICYEGMEWQLVDREVVAPLKTLEEEEAEAAALLATVGAGNSRAKTKKDDDSTSEETELLDLNESVDENATDEESYVTAKFKRSDGSYGYLIFGAVFEDGSICAAPSNLGAYGSRFLSRLDLYGVVDQQDLVMVQLWYAARGKLSRKELEGLQRGFQMARHNVAKAIREQDPSLIPAVMKNSEVTSLKGSNVELNEVDSEIAPIDIDSLEVNPAQQADGEKE
ncbi:exosortase U [Novipirellula artificiosorum]|uniref:Transmembrane exosortase n=1 Tax=Novipirellula artificiosorum TaxID=2528016 RepID=A0A5C6D5N0_9BACT|nr:exosortase U [Novipirellula artificiosorum]TWU32160.1 Transmembrane exosortase [Novipirellula artificiosorum]